MPVKHFLSALFVFILGFSSVHAQVLNPAKWTIESSVSEAKTGDELTLIFRTTIDNNWYLYSSEFSCEDGPIKTSFTFQADKSYQLVGGIVAINPIDKHDKIFECDVKIFKGKGEFRQKIKVLSSPLKISGSYEYQVCTELTGQCVPGEGEFLFDKIKVSGSKSQSSKSQVPNPKSSSIEATKDSCSIEPEANNSQSVTSNQQPIHGPQLDPALVQQDVKGKSLWGFFLLAFFAGLAALLTPCVFPMIPMTVSFFYRPRK